MAIHLPVSRRRRICLTAEGNGDGLARDPEKRLAVGVGNHAQVPNAAAR
jgi:hypothetical protein